MNEDRKEEVRIKRRNMIAKRMLENRRQFGERKIKDKSKDIEKFNKRDWLKRYENFDEE